VERGESEHDREEILVTAHPADEGGCRTETRERRTGEESRAPAHEACAEQGDEDGGESQEEGIHHVGEDRIRRGHRIEKREVSLARQRPPEERLRVRKKLTQAEDLAATQEVVVVEQIAQGQRGEGENGCQCGGHSPRRPRCRLARREATCFRSTAPLDGFSFRSRATGLGVRHGANYTAKRPPEGGPMKENECHYNRS
jgi:hypothetical protein